MPDQRSGNPKDGSAHERVIWIYLLATGVILTVSSLLEYPEKWWRVILYFIIPLVLSVVSFWQLIVRWKR